MKDNLRSENEKYVSNDTSCKAAYEIMSLSSMKSKIRKIKKVKNKKKKIKKNYCKKWFI